MAKEVLQITITERKAPKSKIGKWFYWRVWFQVWSIWRPKVKSKFFGAMSKIMLSLLPKEKREALLKEYEEIEVRIVNEMTGEDGEMVDTITNALRSQMGVDFDEEEFKKRLEDEFKNLT